MAWDCKVTQADLEFIKRGGLDKWGEAKKLKSAKRIIQWWDHIGSKQCSFCDAFYFSRYWVNGLYQPSKCRCPLRDGSLICNNTWHQLYDLVEKYEYKWRGQYDYTAAKFIKEFHDGAVEMYNKIKAVTIEDVDRVFNRFMEL